MTLSTAIIQSQTIIKSITYRSGRYEINEKWQKVGISPCVREDPRKSKTIAYCLQIAIQNYSNAGHELEDIIRVEQANWEF